jgi:hypothetical protein
MKKELDGHLCKKYPKIFRDRHASMQTTCMCWGFDVDDGWYNIINMLCANIQGHIDQTRKSRVSSLLFNRALSRAIKYSDEKYLVNYFSRGEKVTEWATKIAKSTLIEHKEETKFRKVDAKPRQVVASQVKEKFGTLRFYINGGDDYIYGLISMAESMSSVTCEICGKPGTVNGGSWLSTRCEEHAK